MKLTCSLVLLFDYFFLQYFQIIFPRFSTGPHRLHCQTKMCFALFRLSNTNIISPITERCRIRYVGGLRFSPHQEASSTACPPRGMKKIAPPSSLQSLSSLLAASLATMLCDMLAKLAFCGLGGKAPATS